MTNLYLTLKKHSILSIVALYSILSFGCQKNATTPNGIMVQSNVSLSGHVTNHPNTKIIIFHYNDYVKYTKDTIAVIKTDAEGKFKTSCKVEKEITAYGKLGDHLFELYLYPNSDLIIKVDAEGKFAYEGKAAIENNFIAKVENIGLREHVHNAIDQLEPKAFKLFTDSLDKELVGLCKSYFSKYKSDTNFEAIVTNDLTNVKFLISDIYNEQLEKRNKQEVIKVPEVNYFEGFEISDNPNVVSREYVMVLHRYFQHLLKKDFAGLPHEQNKWNFEQQKSYYLKQIALIQKHIAHEELKEILNALAIKESLREVEDLDIYSQLIEEYKKTSHSDKHLNTILSSYEARKKLAPGMPAPNFKLKDINGLEFSIDDFKGSVVFVNFWASWCGPCKEELPYLSKLSRELADEKIMFVNINIKDHKKKWKKHVRKFEMSGVNLHANGDQTRDILKKYDILRIPRYLLIDKEGKIISSYAPKPSTLSTEDFKKYLQTAQLAAINN